LIPPYDYPPESGAAPHDDALNHAEAGSHVPAPRTPAPSGGLPEIQPADGFPGASFMGTPSGGEHYLQQHQSPGGDHYSGQGTPSGGDNRLQPYPSPVPDCESIADSFYTAESPSPLPPPVVDELQLYSSPQTVLLDCEPATPPSPDYENAASYLDMPGRGEAGGTLREDDREALGEQYRSITVPPSLSADGHAGAAEGGCGPSPELEAGDERCRAVPSRDKVEGDADGTADAGSLETDAVQQGTGQGGCDENDVAAPKVVGHTAPDVRWEPQPLEDPRPSPSPRIGTLWGTVGPRTFVKKPLPLASHESNIPRLFNSKGTSPSATHLSGNGLNGKLSTKQQGMTAECSWPAVNPTLENSFGNS
jgi:hypothetical protein